VLSKMKAFHTAILPVVLALVSLGSWAQTATPIPVESGTRDSAAFLERAIHRPKLPDHEKEIDRLLSQMTLQEKIGQMTQFDIAMVSDGKDQTIHINPEKLEKAIGRYGVGSILNVYDEALAPAAWHQMIGQIQAAAARTRLKIPVLYGIDSIHGANYVQGATLFPQPLAMAATWNPELLLHASQITADETRAAGIPWTFSPVLDIGRQPLWPRLYETYGEDPHLASVMGVAVIRGYEGNDPASEHSIAACLKHYVGYSGPASGRDRTPALIPEVALRQYYLPTFRAAINAGARTVMVNSADVNGIPGHVNHYLLTDVLRTEMKFDGLVVSDWEDIKKLVTVHRVAADEKEATRISVMAGVDMSMVPRDYSFPDLLTQLVNEGAVPVTRIDEAVRRILRVKYQLGLFNRSTPDPSWVSRIGTKESRSVSLQAAHESITLLKNDGAVLPLKPTARVLLTGPTADTLVAMSNGWTYTWQGDKADLYPSDRPTLKQALSNRAGKGNLTYVAGADFQKEIDITAAVDAAASADVVVLALGEASYTETPGNIPDLTLPEAQLRLAEAILATGKPTVLVLIEGRPRVISRIADRIPAILMAYNPSNEGGQALADIIFGDVNPSGRLPVTYPRSPNALTTYDHPAFEEKHEDFAGKAFQPQFPFGAGLSYTTFAYSELAVTPANVGSDAHVNVSVKVANTGSLAGKEVVQVYVSDLVATRTPAGKRLVRFAKIAMEPKATQPLTFQLSRDDLSFIGADNKPVVEPGEFEITVGGLHSRFHLSK
jgi:beta-glucosidase